MLPEVAIVLENRDESQLMNQLGDPAGRAAARQLNP